MDSAVSELFNINSFSENSAISPNGGALKQTHISPSSHSNIGLEDTDIVPAATSVPVAVTGVSAGSKLTTRGKNSGALHHSEAHASSPAAKAKKASARRSYVAGTLTIAQKTKKTADNVRKQVSCVGRLNVGKKITKASSAVAALDKDLVQAVGEPVAPAVTPKKLTSNDEFVSFASDHPFDIPGLRASSIDEGSEGDERHQLDMHQMSSALPEDESSDDEDIRLGGDNEGFMTYGCDSPRAKFLAGCIEMNIPPRNALILRAKVTSVLFLEHHGIGDRLALLLAPALAAMPLVSGINIGDNNLTDVGLEPIINSVANCLHVRDFNMSENIIGPKATAALTKLLDNPDYRLETVTLRKCVPVALSILECSSQLDVSPGCHLGSS